MFIKFYALKRWLISGAAVLLAVPLLVSAGVYCAPMLTKTGSIMSQNQWVFTIFRWMVLALFYWYWPYLVRHRANLYAWTERKTDYWLSQRAKIMAWLILFEVIVCENALWRLFHCL